MSIRKGGGESKSKAKAVRKAVKQPGHFFWDRPPYFVQVTTL